MVNRQISLMFGAWQFSGRASQLHPYVFPHFPSTIGTCTLVPVHLCIVSFKRDYICCAWLPPALQGLLWQHPSPRSYSSFYLQQSTFMLRRRPISSQFVQPPPPKTPTTTTTNASSLFRTTLLSCRTRRQTSPKHHSISFYSITITRASPTPSTLPVSVPQQSLRLSLAFPSLFSIAIQCFSASSDAEIG